MQVWRKWCNKLHGCLPGFPTISAIAVSKRWIILHKAPTRLAPRGVSLVATKVQAARCTLEWKLSRLHSKACVKTSYKKQNDIYAGIYHSCKKCTESTCCSTLRYSENQSNQIYTNMEQKMCLPMSALHMCVWNVRMQCIWTCAVPDSKNSRA